MQTDRSIDTHVLISVNIVIIVVVVVVVVLVLVVQTLPYLSRSKARTLPFTNSIMYRSLKWPGGVVGWGGVGWGGLPNNGAPKERNN
jgi:energy-converting hydrogenase Eha subunit A